MINLKKTLPLILLIGLSLTSCKTIKDIEPGTYNLEKRICNELLNIDVEFDIYEGGSTYTSVNITIEPDPLFSHKEFLSSNKTEVFANFEDGAYLIFSLKANGGQKSHKVSLTGNGAYSETIKVEHDLTSQENFKWEITNYGGTVWIPIYEGAILKYNNIEYKGISNESLIVQKIPDSKTVCLDSHIILGNKKIQVGDISYMTNLMTRNRVFTPKVKNFIFRGNYDDTYTPGIVANVTKEHTYYFNEFKNLKMIAIEKLELEPTFKNSFILPEGNIDFYVDMENELLIKTLKETNYVGNIYSFDSLDLSQYDLTNSGF